MNNFIFRSHRNFISGYKKLAHATFDILNKNYSLISLFDDGCKNENFNTPHLLNKSNFFSKELFISPLPHSKDQAFTNFLPYKDNISIMTMWETDVLHRYCVNELNDTAAKIFVPCLWNLETFKKSGVKNVELLNLFVDDKFFHYKSKKDLSKFTFFCGAHLDNFQSANERKDITLIIECFLKLFRDNDKVELVVKASGANKKNISQYINSNIKVVYDYLNDEEFSELLSTADVFISSSKSEGWGFFQIESLAIGRPVITIDYGGVKEFCDNNNSFFIDYEEELATGFFGKSGGCWAKINKQSLIDQMLHVYKNKDVIRHNWQFYSKSVLPKFNLKNYENHLLNALNK